MMFLFQATDADIGLNAQIKYTTESDHFSVHPGTGMVYPKSDLYSLLETDEELSITVVATDENGNGPHQVGLEINVGLSFLNGKILSIFDKLYIGMFVNVYNLPGQITGREPHCHR